MSQLVLGTAQFGYGYGITNTRGRVDDREIAQIVDLASEAGVSRIDTAAVYGDALNRLRPWASAFSFTSKIVGTDSVDPVEQIERSLEALGRDCFEACLVREWESVDFSGRDLVVERMISALEQGLVERIGVAAYTSDDVHSFRRHLDRAGVDMGAVQVPANPLDRRLDGDVQLQDLAASGTDVAVRSAFLQGLLVDEAETQFLDHPELRRYWDFITQSSSVSPIQACLAHVKALPWATHVVVGVSSVVEWEQILSSWSAASPELLPMTLASTDEVLLDPRLWRS